MIVGKNGSTFLISKERLNRGDDFIRILVRNDIIKIINNDEITLSKLQKVTKDNIALRLFTNDPTDSVVITEKTQFVLDPREY